VILKLPLLNQTHLLTIFYPSTLLLLLLQPFYGPQDFVSGTTQVSRYQKGKTNLDLLEQEIVSGSGISWAICRSAPRPRQITMPESHHSVIYRPDALPAAQPTASEYWRQLVENSLSVGFWMVYNWSRYFSWHWAGSLTPETIMILFTHAGPAQQNHEK